MCLLIEILRDHERTIAVRIWGRQLELYLGTWEGEYLESRAIWLRFFDVHGNLILIAREDLQRRADELEAELTRLRTQLAAQEQGGAS